MSIYEAWRITYQSSEAAARAAYNTVEKLHEENQALRKYVDGLRAALGAQVRFGSEGFLAAIEKLPRYTYNYASEDGKFLLRDEVLAAIASQARQATPTADMGNTTSQPPSATEAGNPASGAQDKMPPTQQPEALRLAELIRLSGALPGSVSDDAASELRRLHAENQDLRTRHYCNTAEIESLQHRAQELGEMARENRSKRVIELERRIAELEAVLSAVGEKGDPVKPADIPSATDQDTHFFLAGWNGRAAQVDPHEHFRNAAATAPAHPTEGVPAHDAERWIGIGKAIERACMDLPDGTEINVSLEKDAGTVTLIDPYGNEHENFSTDYGFAGVLNEAIDAAIAAQAKQGE